jgi:RNA polymerase sigma-70 factor, ECF subfamily
MQQTFKTAGVAGADADVTIVDGLIAGDPESFSVAMRRYNQRLFRVARGVLYDDAEAEDVVQETWLKAFRSIGRFERRSTFATWISRIALYEAWSRARRRTRRAVTVRDLEPPPASDDPEAITFGREVREHLGLCVDELPERYRLVYVLREIDGSSTEETATSLGISAPAVKVRLHRARAMLRRRLGRDAGETEARAYRFGGQRCDRTVATVLSALGIPPRAAPAC